MTARDDIRERVAMLREARQLRRNRYRVMNSFQQPAIWGGLALNLMGYAIAGAIASGIGLLILIPMAYSLGRTRRNSAAISGLIDAQLALTLVETEMSMQRYLEGKDGKDGRRS